MEIDISKKKFYVIKSEADFISILTKLQNILKYLWYQMLVFSVVDTVII